MYLMSFGIGGALMAFEEKMARDLVPFLYEKGSGPVNLPKLYAGVILSVVGASFTIAGFAMNVGMSRNKAIEDARKEGDEHAEERYSYPKLYAEGFSETARKFNCMQRTHQHALETFPMLLATAILGGLRFPGTTTFGMIMWIYSRKCWSASYSDKGAEKRYDHWSSRGIWISLLLQVCTATGTAVGLILDM